VPVPVPRSTIPAPDSETYLRLPYSFNDAVARSGERDHGFVPSSDHKNSPPLVSV
jgi:hypothetical protein